MERIRKLATHSVLRGTGFSVLAISLAMAALISVPVIALRVGGIGFLVLAVAMDLKAMIYPYKRRIRESEVWIMLEDHERPMESTARPLIVSAMQQELREKALWIAWTSASCFILSFATRVPIF